MTPATAIPERSAGESCGAGSVRSAGQPSLGDWTPTGAAADGRGWIERLSAWKPLGCDLPDFASRVILGGLFASLTARLVADFLETGRITGLLLVASEALVVVLTIIRRPAVEVDRSWVARSVAALSILGPPLLAPASRAIAPDIVTAAVSACGLALVVAAKISLGRSFGVVPANRGIVRSGLYRFVRHPIYLGYLVTHGAFLAGNLTAWNFLVLAMSDIALVARSLVEERTLANDARYVTYRAEVRWRLLPGVF